jgi:hypothetical protein
MSDPFNAQQGAIILVANVEGPSGTIPARLVLDTGATVTMISPGILVLAGHDPSQAVSHQSIVTASGRHSLPVVFTKRIEALGQTRLGFPLLAHTLPPGAGVDGVLGLDFFRGRTLNIDFRLGQITLV